MSAIAVRFTRDMTESDATQASVAGSKTPVCARRRPSGSLLSSTRSPYPAGAAAVVYSCPGASVVPTEATAQSRPCSCTRVCQSSAL